MQQNCDEFDFALAENPLPARFQLYRKQKKLTDVTIKVGDVEIAAHRLVLEDSCPVIRAALSENWSNGKKLEFNEDSLDWEIVEDLLDFFYTARIKITLRNAYSLCLAAHYLHIPDLLEACEKFLSSKLSLENIVSFYILSTKLELKVLRKNCSGYFAIENKNILKDEKLLSLSLEEITQILEEMKINNEDDEDLRENMFRFMMSWVEYDSQNRESSLPILLRFLPVYELSHGFLSEEVSTHPMITNSLTCSRLLIEALSKAVSNSRFSRSKGCQLYCLGGENENGKCLSSVSEINLTSKLCKSLPEMFSKKAYFGATVIGDKIYVCGGWNENIRLNTLELFDCQTNNWSKLAPMHHERSSSGMTTLNNMIFVSGGYNNSNVSLSGMEQFCPNTNTWTEVKAMNKGRSAHELVSLNGEIFAIGGYNTKTVEKYNPTTDEWNYVASTQNSHYHFGAAVHNDKIYVLSENGFEVYDSCLNVWKNLTKLSIVYGTQLICFNDKLLAVGGRNFNDLKSIFEYDIASNSWQKLFNMDVARKFHRSVVVKC